MWTADEKEIGEHVTCYFQNLFTASSPRDFHSILQYIDPKISEADNTMLMAPVSDEEVKQATLQLGGTKAPGPDGFHGRFYQKSWSVVGRNVTEMVRAVLKRQSDIHVLNDTNLVLIPKNDKPEMITQFRPISLCNFSYKIISKILANRLKVTLQKCIAETQGAFVPGRLIHDNVVIAHEVFHYLRRKKSGNKYEFALKMDMSKAYDRIEWDFLKSVMLRMGYYEEWTDLIMACVGLVNMNVCLSGRRVSSFKPGCGLWQGDPLSPYLFILVEEVLSCILTKETISKQLKGIKLSNQGPLISHTFFADDALFFMNANLENCRRLMKVLELYCVASGQCANLSKSGLIFSQNTPLSVREQVSQILRIPIVEDQGKYLGIPNVWGKSKHQALSYVKEKIGKKVQGWKKNLLSSAG